MARSAKSSARRRAWAAVAIIPPGGPPLLIKRGAPFSWTPPVFGGSPPSTVALVSGSIPGVSFSGGTYSGTPTALGTSTITFQATDSKSISGPTSSYAIVTADVPAAATLSSVQSAGIVTHTFTHGAANGTPVLGGNLYRSTVSGFIPSPATFIRYYDGPSPLVAANPLANGTYYYLFASVNALGEGAMSAQTSVTIAIAGPATLAALTLSTLTANAGSAWTSAISGATSGSVITATSSDGTTLTVNGAGTSVSGTFAAGGSPSITLTETLAGATNSPLNSVSGLTVSAVAPALATLVLANLTATTASAWTSAISGKTAGSVITAASSDGTALTVDGSGTSVSGTFPANGSKTITLVETLAGATGSPKSTVSTVTASAVASSISYLGTDIAYGAGALGADGLLASPLKTIAASGATQTLSADDNASGFDPVYDVTLTADCAFTLSAPNKARKQTMDIRMRQDATGGRTPRFLSNVSWAGAQPNFTRVANRSDIIRLRAIGNSPNWQASIVAMNITGA